MRTDSIDVHQQLWPDELVDRLQARTRPPYQYRVDDDGTLKRVSLSYADELRPI